MKNVKENSNFEYEKKNSINKKGKKPVKYERIVSDVLGSYTGVPRSGEEPVQDVDDL